MCEKNKRFILFVSKSQNKKLSQEYSKNGQSQIFIVVYRLFSQGFLMSEIKQKSLE